MRTQSEIIDRIEEVKDGDSFGFERGNLIDFLDYEHAKPFLKSGTTSEEWEECRKTDPKEAMRNYMEFAWEKANGCRGISAYRSLCHFSAWLWLDGNGELAESIRNYEFYGKPELEQICEYLGMDVSQYDNGVRTNVDS